MQEFLTGKAKRYRATIRFGVVSETLDGESEAIATGRVPTALAAEDARGLLSRFLGPQLQVPPIYSALRVKGRRAYDLARRGREAEMTARPIEVHSIDLVGFTPERWIVDILCSAGTYIRSLARDIGEAAGCGAILEDLRRTGSGEFDVEAAHDPETVTRASIVPLSAALGSEGRIDVTGEDIRLLRAGDIIMPQGWCDPAKTWFAWVDGRPCFRLKFTSPGFARSDLMLEDPTVPRSTE